VLCPNCKTENLGDSNICTNCGSHIRATVLTRNKKTTQLWMLVGALVLIVGFFLVYKFIMTAEKSTLVQYETADIESPVYELTPKAQASLKHAIGKVIAQTSMGVDLSQIDTAIVSRNWVALPICACLEGEIWMFHPAESQGMERARIVSGIWKSGNPVGLWQLEKNAEYDSLELAPWDRGVFLVWHSLDMARSVGQVPALSPKQAGYFTSIALQADVAGPGVFTQNDQIVGWTFGEWIEGGILWDPPQEFRLKEVVSLDVSEFVHAVSSQWQESLFSKGLATRANTVPIDKLRLLVEGFLMYPQFSSEFKPHSLRPEFIASKIHTLASELMNDGLSKEVMDVFSDDFILEVKNSELLKDATLTRVNTYDHWKAVQYLERMKRRMFSGGERYPSDLDTFHSQLYKDWIKKSIDGEIFHSGRIGFEAGRSLFPDDAELHLLGIDLAVAENNWERAEELLKMRSYPQRFQAKKRLLESLIEKRLDEERTVILRFSPGSSHIPVKAYLNRQVWQDFIIDTGAEVSLIPSSAARALRLKVTRGTPVRGIAGIVGVTLAYEVVMDSIELKGFSVRNMPVLVVDMLGQSDVGVLGNDFLKNFDIEIDNQNGILKLRPRKRY
jgi:predicted aspartyl protease/predicted nucleic acid-binding Zn ribbon protein